MSVNPVGDTDLKKVFKILVLCLFFYSAFNHILRVMPGATAYSDMAWGANFYENFHLFVIKPLDNFRLASGDVLMVPFYQCPSSASQACELVGNGIRIALGLH